MGSDDLGSDDLGSDGFRSDQPNTPAGAAAQAPVGAAVERPALQNAFFTIAVVFLVFTALAWAGDYLSPIALAVLIWFLINAIATGLRTAPVLERVVPESLALVLASALVLGVIWLVGGIIVQNIGELGDGLVGFEAKADAAVQALEGYIGLSLDLDVGAMLQDLRVQAFLSEILSAVTSAVGYLSLVLLYVLFLVLDQPFYDAKIRALFPNADRQHQVRAVLSRVSADTRAYVWIMTVVSALVGGFTYAAALYFGLKGAAFWGFLAFALNFIPTIGTLLGVLFPALFALAQFDSPETALYFVVSLAAAQFFMGNVLLPRWTGQRLNLSEFVVILSLTIWGALWGVAGLFLAVPLMMVLNIVLAQFPATRPVAILLSKRGKVVGGDGVMG